MATVWWISLRVLLDTSFLILLASKPANLLKRLEEVLSGAELIVLEGTIRELERLMERQSIKRAREAELALKFAQNLKSVKYERGAAVDEKILDYAVSHGVVVATMDRQLRMKLRQLGIAVITCGGKEVFLEGRSL